MIPKEDITKTHITGAYATQINKGTNEEGFFVEKTIVNVKYLSNKNVPVPALLKACQICSESIGREKRNSATKDVFVEIAKCTDKFLRGMTDDALIGNPALGKFEYPSANKFPKTITSAKDVPAGTGDLDWKTDRGRICKELENVSILSTDIFVKYAQDPFNQMNYSDFMKELEVPRLKKNNDEDDSVLIKPPFVVSYRSMAVHAGVGENQRATTEMLNKWCLLPQFIHLLLAHKMNMSLVEAAKDEKVAQIVIYAMRHHVTNHGTSNLVCDLCTPWYGLKKEPNVAEGDNNVIIAALYLTEIVNAALTTISENDGDIKSKKKLKQLRKERLLKEISDVTMLFSTMNIYANSPGIDTMIDQLGENIYIL